MTDKRVERRGRSLHVMGGDRDDLLRVKISERARRAVLHLVERCRCRLGHVKVMQLKVIVIALVVGVLVERAPTRVHEEVSDGGDFEAELLGDRRLHLLRRSLRLLEDGHQRAPLDVGEDETRLLGAGHFLFYHIIFTLARCKTNKDTLRHSRQRRRRRRASQPSGLTSLPPGQG